MQAFVDYLKENKPDATIAMLQANDDFGQSYADTLKQLVKGTQLKIVKTEQYDSTGAEVETQVTNLAEHEGRRVLPRRPRCWRARPRLSAAATAGLEADHVHVGHVRVEDALQRRPGPTADKRAQRHAAARPGRPEEREQSGDEAVQGAGRRSTSRRPTSNDGIVAYGWTTGGAAREDARERQEARPRLGDGGGPHVART